MDARDAQLEVVHVGGMQQRFFVRDQAFAVQVVERLVEGLHPVLRSAGGDGVADEAGFLRDGNTVADVGGRNQHFHRRHAPVAVRAAHQALGNDGSKSAGHLHANLLLLGRRKDGDDALDGFRGIERVQGGEDQVAGFRRQQSSGDGFQVAHFAHQNHVRVLAQPGAERGGKVRGVNFHFALVDEALFVAVQKLDRVLDGHDVVGTRRVDPVNHGGQRSGLAAAGGSGDQHQPAFFFADLVDYGRKHQVVNGLDFGRDDPQDHAHVAALLENVHAETSQPRHAVRQVEFGCFLELLLLPVGHHAEGHRQHFLGGDAGLFRQRVEAPVDSQVGVVADLQMQVGGLALNCYTQQVVNVHCS